MTIKIHINKFGEEVVGIELESPGRIYLRKAFSINKEVLEVIEKLLGFVSPDLKIKIVKRGEDE